MKVREGVEIYLHAFISSPLEGITKLSDLLPVPLSAEERVPEIDWKAPEPVLTLWRIQ
jgi:hypothetical protein